MTELYRNRSIWKRTAAYFVVVLVATLWGLWELWNAAHGPAEQASNGYLFGALFIGGSAYSLYQLVNDWRDVVTLLTRDDATGAISATLWEPSGPRTIAGRPSEFRNWRPHVKPIGRINKAFFIYVDHAAVPRPLRFDLPVGSDVEGLRRVAPEAVAEYEVAVGVKAQPTKVS